MEYPITYEMYQEFLRQGKFMGLKCTGCGAVIFPPQAICRDCKGMEFERIPIKNTGHIRTFTVIRVPPEGFEPNYVVVMVELDDGAWVVGRLIRVDPDSVGFDIIGKRVSMEPVTINFSGKPAEENYILGFKMEGGDS